METLWSQPIKPEISPDTGKTSTGPERTFQTFKGEDWYRAPYLPHRAKPVGGDITCPSVRSWSFPVGIEGNWTNLKFNQEPPPELIWRHACKIAILSNDMKWKQKIYNKAFNHRIGKNRQHQKHKYRKKEKISTQELCPSPQATTAKSSILQTCTKSSSPPVSTYFPSGLPHTSQTRNLRSSLHIKTHLAKLLPELQRRLGTKQWERWEFVTRQTTCMNLTCKVRTIQNTKRYNRVMMLLSCLLSKDYRF